MLKTRKKQYERIGVYMLVSEIRKEIEKYNQKEISDLVIELYKRIPKKIKEEYHIDDLIVNINNKSKKEEKFDFNSLKQEIIAFLEDVDNGYYSHPNKIISKSERSKWRFKVKRYIKELNKISPDAIEGIASTQILIKLYELLSEGSNYLKFSNWETFRAVGISQADFYDLIVKRIFTKGYTTENLKIVVQLLKVPKDPYSLDEKLIETLITNLPTIDTKIKVIDLLKKEVDELADLIAVEKDYHKRFNLKELHNLLVEGVFRTSISMHEVQNGILYYRKHDIEIDKEITEFKILEYLENKNLIKDWIKEYESTKDKIDYRDSIKEKYKKLKETNY